jgi:hypothetical protein
MDAGDASGDASPFAPTSTVRNSGQWLAKNFDPSVRPAREHMRWAREHDRMRGGTAHLQYASMLKSAAEAPICLIVACDAGVKVIIAGQKVGQRCAPLAGETNTALGLFVIKPLLPDPGVHYSLGCWR